jgi:predicted ATPase/class 3 adenylate cyclase
VETLAFLFTDIEGSTALLQRVGDGAYAGVLADHHAVIRSALAAHEGREVVMQGDGFFAVFSSPRACVAAVLAMQHALQAHPWPGGEQVRVRMGIHCGEATQTAAGLVGLDIHRAARVAAVAHGGQVLVSESAAVLVRDWLPEGSALTDLGVHQLKDLGRPEQIFQLTSAGLEAEFPPLRTLTALPNNLPASTDRLVGREPEILQVARALNDSRLVTLTGPGGSGKTRLALAVGASLLTEFSDGVWLVQLATATLPEQVQDLVAQELRVGERAGEPLLTTLQEKLCSRELLIVLDNCEHLVDAAASLMDALLSRCPRLRALATSRELLGVRGECVVPVEPLGVGDEENPGDAVELFVERAGSVVPGFSAATADIRMIADVCRRLDGLPLAIELAAARLRTIALGQLAERLDNRFRLLTGGSRAAIGRQRTLEAVVAWSYDLLAPPEQWLFRRLTVFPDSFPLDAVQSVADDEIDVLETLGHLVDKSLLVPTLVGGEYRYRMLETLRQFGREHLLKHGEAEKAQDRLLAWVLTLADRLERDMRTSRQDAAILAVLPERANARAALEWALESGDVPVALRIASSVPVMLASERLRLLVDLMARASDVPDTVRGQVLVTLGNLTMEQGQWDDCARFTTQAAAIFERLGDLRNKGWAQYFEALGIAGKPEGRERARKLALNLIEVFGNLHDDFGLAYALCIASVFATEQDEAEHAASASVRLFRELGAGVGLAHALEATALAALRTGGFSVARRALPEALGYLADAENLGCTAHCLEAVAALLVDTGRLEEAALMLGAAEGLRREIHQAKLRAWELQGLERALRGLAAADDIEPLEAARSEGRQLPFLLAVQRAQELLSAHQRGDEDNAPP